MAYMTDREIRGLCENLRKAKNNIKQLCDTVNHFSQQLGLGQKVAFEDFVEPVNYVLERVRPK